MLIVVLVGATASSWTIVSDMATAGRHALVLKRGEVVSRLNLSEARTVEVQGMVGKVMVESRGGLVAVTSAVCPNHTCVRTGWRSRAGEVIVCIPNGIVVRILGEPRGVEAVTG